jgi:hypothetical protein
MKKTHRRLDQLEDQLISKPTILHMPKKKKVLITGPKNYLLTLASVCTNRENATKEQVKQLDLIQNCVWAQEPGGSRIIEVIKCFQAGPVDTVVKSESPDGPAGTEGQAGDGGQPTPESGVK